MIMKYKTELTCREEWLLIWWYLFDSPKFDSYTEGVALGMAKKFAIKRAKKYGNNDDN